MAASRAGLPPFAPHKSSLTSPPTKKLGLPEPTNRFLSLVWTIIQNRPRKFKHAPCARPKHWWRLREHRQPTLWGLYRGLLRYSKHADLAMNVKMREGQTTGRGEGTASERSLVLRTWIKFQFREQKNLRTIPSTQEALRNGYKLLDELIRADSGDTGAMKAVQRRRDALLETRRRSTWAKVYKAELDARAKKPRTPIMTGRFLRPTIFNGPLPRLAHQPLHISMMIASRRKAYERRLAQHRQLKEHLEMAQTEHKFEQDLGIHLSAEERSGEVDPMKDRLKVINKAHALEREREKKVYSRELLDKIEAARRRRPVVLRERNSWKRMQRRLSEIDLATQDDGPETAEGKPFRVPGPDFWKQ